MNIIGQSLIKFTLQGASVLYSALVKKRIPNISGDRDIEWSWISAQMPNGPGNALDFGPGRSSLSLVAAQRGFEVTAVDLVPVQWFFRHQRIKFIQNDLSKVDLPLNYFDLIINCSVIEHVGLAGRYGVDEDQENGDLETMKYLKTLMVPGGLMLLTIPAGKDAVYYPLHRVYGNERLPRFIKGYHVEKEKYWSKPGRDNIWQETDKETALNFTSSASSWNPLQNIYALACFVLKKLK